MRTVVRQTIKLGGLLFNEQRFAEILFKHDDTKDIKITKNWVTARKWIMRNSEEC